MTQAQIGTGQGRYALGFTKSTQVPIPQARLLNSLIECQQRGPDTKLPSNQETMRRTPAGAAQSCDA